MTSIENTVVDGTNISSEGLSGPSSSSAASSISADQLMDYIKKQKQKIKTLETKLQKYEQSSKTSKSKDSSDTTKDSSDLLFWEFIHKQSAFHQRLAKRALSSMIYTFENSKLGQMYVPTTKNLFYRWKEQTMLQKLTTITTLEQKNAKLKALLARTHSINQKNLEDSNMLKQRQQDALMELKSLKEREESERQVCQFYGMSLKIS
jgi:hypothetical protein